jgi:hypothetical protein
VTDRQTTPGSCDGGLGRCAGRAPVPHRHQADGNNDHRVHCDVANTAIGAETRSTDRPRRTARKPFGGVCSGRVTKTPASSGRSDGAHC